ncbi:MAG: hotdog domain-containing protein [Syntrophomonas sp.]|nr:hotdog domain-containing protein [Syntrophomonas sp.]
MNRSITVPMLVSPALANKAGIFPGSEILKFMGVTAGMAGFRYCKKRVVTAMVGPVSFPKSVSLGELVYCTADVIYTGTTSMGIQVRLEIEKDDSPIVVAQGFWVMVAVDADGHPQTVESLPLENEEQKWLSVKAITIIKTLRGI